VNAPRVLRCTYLVVSVRLLKQLLASHSIPAVSMFFLFRTLNLYIVIVSLLLLLLVVVVVLLVVVVVLVVFKIYILHFLYFVCVCFVHNYLFVLS
jgi:hypothetical protein